jgi:CelD/BcsL family acetyltransferase involved in cellulose biosynthesis
VEGGTAFIHKLAYVEAAKPLSPGTSLSAALFETVIDHDRVSHIDFGTGDDPYKRDWMDQQRPRWRLVAMDPRRPGQWPAILRAVVKRGITRPGL